MPDARKATAQGDSIGSIRFGASFDSAKRLAVPARHVIGSDGNRTAKKSPDKGRDSGGISRKVEPDCRAGLIKRGSRRRFGLSAPSRHGSLGMRLIFGHEDL